MLAHVAGPTAHPAAPPHASRLPTAPTHPNPPPHTQVAFYLNKYLGRYVSGLDAESLKISVWKGDVELRNLLLKPEALAGLNLPITVKSGLLGKLTLKVGGG
jgi:hypothetical protein